jgi:hypothetical protein
VKVFAYLYHGMRAVIIRQLWGRAWDLFKVNWLLFVGLLVLFIAQFIIAARWDLYISILMTIILAPPVLVRAGYLVARQGQSSFGEAFGDISLLLKVLIYQFILGLIPGSFVGLGHVFMVLMDFHGVILVLVGYHLLFISYLLGWAGPYAILSGRAGIFRAIGQSFSLTAQNFGKVFLGLLSFTGLAILGAIPCGVGLLVVGPMWCVFWPLLYLALTDEEGVSHS